MTRRFTEEEAAARNLASKARWRDRNRDRLRAYDKERSRNPMYKAMKIQWQRARRERLREAAPPARSPTEQEHFLSGYQTINSTP